MTTLGTTLEARAQELIDYLFTNGQGDRADRLVLMAGRDPERNLGGWSRYAVIAKLIEFGREARTEGKREALEQRDELLAELRNIAEANPHKWEADVRDQFQQWAQNRARLAINRGQTEGRTE